MTQILMGVTFWSFFKLMSWKCEVLFIGLFFINRKTFMNLIRGFTDEKTQVMFE